MEKQQAITEETGTVNHDPKPPGQRTRKAARPEFPVGAEVRFVSLNHYHSLSPSPVGRVIATKGRSVEVRWGWNNSSAHPADRLILVTGDAEEDERRYKERLRMLDEERYEREERRSSRFAEHLKAAAAAAARRNVEHGTREQQKDTEKAKKKEIKLKHQLGLQMIDTGYKALATKLHPDKGGSTEAMTRLKRVHDEAVNLWKSCTGGMR